ncbi:MAG: carbohydrate ABC transporter permease [Acidimicrobiales bacterium]
MSSRAPVRRRGRRLREAALGYFMLLPALCVFAVFVFYPFARNFKLALYETPPYPNLPSTYVGLHQVGQVLSSSNFIESLVTTFLFVALVVPAGLLFGLFLAVVAQRHLRGIAAYRIIFSSTVVTSVAVSALVFYSLMNPVVGLLPWLGINPHPSVLQSTTWALPAIAVMAIWQFMGMSFIIMSAGLQSLPEEVLEAAKMDGASDWTAFWRVTVPLLSPTLFFALVVAMISAFQTFGQIDILIGYQNAAYEHVNVLIYNIYTTLVYEQNPGRSAVMSIALFAITLVLTVIQLRLLERRVHYGR